MKAPLHVPTIAAGMIGAVLGFLAALMLLALVGFGNPMDPIASGILALAVIAPLGALAGLIVAVKVATAMRGEGAAGGFTRNAVAALVAVVASTGVIGGLVTYYYVATATPWLNPKGGNPLLLFEVRLPSGAPPPSSADDIRIDLQTDLNAMPGKVDALRRDDDRALIAGHVELAYRTPYRQVEIKIAGQPERVFPLRLSDRAPHARAFSAWQKEADGSEIRYRPKWPGQE